MKKDLREKFILILLLIWFVIPLLMLVKTSFRVDRYLYLIISGAIGLISLIVYIIKELFKRKDKKEFFIKNLPIFIFGAYMIWTFISCIYSPNINNAIFGTENRLEGYLTYMAYAGFFSLAYFLKSDKHTKIILNTFVIISVINCIIIEITNRIDISQIFNTRNITTGVYINSNHYGYYLLIATTCINLLLITEKNKYKTIVYAIGYIILLYYFIVNDTLGCYLAFIVTMILLLIYCIIIKKRVWTVLFTIFIFILMSCVAPKGVVKKNINLLKKDTNIIVSTISTNNTNKEIEETKKDKIKNDEWKKTGSGRLNLWYNGVEFFLERPILGYGPENLKDKYLEYKIDQDRPHNLIIQLATTSGAPGLILYLLAVGIIIKRNIKSLNIENRIQTISLFTVIAYFISAMFGNSMYYTSPYFFIFLGFLMSEGVKRIYD